MARSFFTQASAPANQASAAYLVYVALLTQTGTSAPVATVLQNTLGGTITWARTASSTYTATLTNAFTANKTATFISGNNAAALSFASIKRTSVSVITVNVADMSGNGETDGLLNAATVEIRVYS